MISVMHARRHAAQSFAASSVQLRRLVCVVLPAPVRAATAEAASPVLTAALTLLLGLTALSFWYWKRRSDRALQLGEFRLEEARRSLRLCQDEARQLAEQAEQARRAAEDERERLAQALFSSEQRLDLHLGCASELVFALDLDGRLQQLSRNWCETLGVDAAKLIGQHHAWLVHPDDLPGCQAAVERALASRSPQGEVEYRIRHAEGDWRWHAARIAPLRDRGGRTVGLLGVARTLGVLRPGPGSLRKAHCDALTGLPGRALCLDRLQQALRQAERHGNRAALLLLAIDDFRGLNERRGHALGDLVLLAAAARISACVRASDTVGRGDGARFMVLLPDVGSGREASELAHKIRLALSEPLQLRNRMLALSASIGVAVYPAHGDDEEELASQAELALRLARQAGRGQVALSWSATTPAARSQCQPA